MTRQPSARSRRKQLTDIELMECNALKLIYEREKKNRPDLTQDSLSESFGYKTQGAISHYLNGVAPLNLEAAVKFAVTLNCNIEDFSPRLAAQLGPLHRIVSPDFKPPPDICPGVSRETAKLIERLRALDSAGGSSPQLLRALAAMLDVASPNAGAQGYPGLNKLEAE